MPAMLLQDLSYMIYIYIYAYIKNFIQLGHKKQNILHMHSEKLKNAINGFMSFSQWISERNSDLYGNYTGVGRPPLLHK